MYIDTHMHLEPGDDVTGVMERAVSAGVTRLVAVGGSVGLVLAISRRPRS